MIKIEGTITPAKIYAVLVLIASVIAMYKGMTDVALFGLAIGGGLYGYRKREARKMMETKR